MRNYTALFPLLSMPGRSSTERLHLSSWRFRRRLLWTGRASATQGSELPPRHSLQPCT